MKYLNPKTFKCENCGECCRPIVVLNETDVKMIEETGLKRKHFLDYDPLHPKYKNILRQENNVCMFLRRKGEEYYCKIYENRPRVCRVYPFYKKDLKLDDCKPKWLRKPVDLKGLVKEE